MNLQSFVLFFLPGFAALVALEHLIGKRRGLALYSRQQTIASLVIALGQQVISAAVPLGLGGMLWRFAYEHRLVELRTDSGWYVPLLFLGVELTYYWFHRLSHEIRWLWATHSVHHSIEEMNILGAYRLGWTGRISLGAVVFTPLCLLGVPPEHFLLATAASLMYQAGLHTTLIGKIPLIEGILNTPSAHRVHHGRNPAYLDRNYGSALMIFDRVFGTYAEEREDEPVEFGLRDPSGSTNPMRIALHEWGNMIGDMRRHPVRHWPMLLFGPPGWAPDGGGARQTPDAVTAPPALGSSTEWRSGPPSRSGCRAVPAFRQVPDGRGASHGPPGIAQGRPGP